MWRRTTRVTRSRGERRTNRGDEVRRIADVRGGRVEDLPAERLDAVPSSEIALVLPATTVVLVAVVLDRETAFGIRRVDARDEVRAVADVELEYRVRETTTAQGADEPALGDALGNAA